MRSIRRRPTIAGVDCSALPSPAVTAFPSTVTRLVILGAVGWTLSIVFFIGQALAETASTRPYGLATNFISDLGNTACGPFSDGGYHANVCSPLHGLMDGTFIVVGLLQIIGAITTRQAWPRRRLTTFGLTLLAIAGGCLIVIGFTPENINPFLHGEAALLGLDCLNVAMILLGLGVVSASRGLGITALAAGIVGIAGRVVFQFSLMGVPVGIAERIADFPATAMVVLLGAFLLWSANPAGGRPRVATR
jgi:hypothetical membrane protein